MSRQWRGLAALRHTHTMDEALLSELDVDGCFLECDTERAGGF